MSGTRWITASNRRRSGEDLEAEDGHHHAFRPEHRGEILIAVSDDGAGIDRRAVLDKAQRKGLLTKPVKDYSDREVYQFLLMPGFSTNDVVTEYSGRGVGMDVVKQNVEKIGGDVTVESTPGQGTRVIFKIP